MEGRVRLAGRLYRHARAVARDVVDTAALRGSESGRDLAALTREVAEVADIELRAEPAQYAIARAEARLETSRVPTEDALVVRAQLRQMLDDLKAGTGPASGAEGSERPTPG